MKYLEQQGIALEMEKEDVQILRENMVDFISLSDYNSSCVRADGSIQDDYRNDYLRSHILAMMAAEEEEGAEEILRAASECDRFERGNLK